MNCKTDRSGRPRPAMAWAAAAYPSNAPIVGIAATPDGNGYWQVASDGGIFALPPPTTAARAIRRRGRRRRASARRPPTWPADGAAWTTTAPATTGTPSIPPSTGAATSPPTSGSTPASPCRPTRASARSRTGLAGTASSARTRPLLQVGDVVFYAQHVSVVIQVQPNGTVVTADGNFGGTRGSEATFASTSHVKIDSFNPRYGQGAAGPITGIGLIG